MTGTARLRSPWIVWASLMTLLAVTLVLSAANLGPGEDAWFYPLAITMILGYSTVGAVIASRQSRNPIGWLMIGVGGAFVVGGFCDEYARYALVTHRGELPGGLAAVWVTNWIYAAMLTFLPLLGLLYPTGHVPGPRWRFLVPLTVAFGAIAIVGSILEPGLVADAPFPTLNPTGIHGFPGEEIAGLAWIGLLLALATAVAAVVVRFRRSTGEERQQIRWLAYVVITAVVVLLVSLASALFVLGESFGSTAWGQALAFVGLGLVGIGVPAAMGVAILKYRLYDLDVVIKKTVVFAILAALITALLVGTILLATTFVSFAAPDEAETPSVAGTLFVVGVLVWPLWRLSKRIADRLVFGGRSSPYEVLTQFSRRVGDTYADEDVLPRMAQVLQQATRARVARVWLAVRDELRLEASAPSDAPRLPSAVRIHDDTVPNLGDEHVTDVRHRGELVGALAVSTSATDPMNPSKEKLVRDLAAQAGPVLRNVRLVADLRESRRRIVSTQDERARRLERDIHDGAQQQLVALGVKMRLIEPLMERDPVKARELLEQLQTDATDALENLRDLARGIYPPLLADKGLAAALEAQSRKAVVPVRLEPDGVGRYPQEIESAVYFCVLEALQNISKYANATAVRIAVWERDERLGFEVRDDGVGFDPGSASRGTGLQGMADRLDAVGGELRISSTPGRGTTISGAVSLPGNAGSAGPTPTSSP